MRHASAHDITLNNVPRSRTHEGRFGRLFGRGFSAWVPPGATEADKEKAVADQAALMFTDLPPQDSAIPVGYTYFGQFVDHDITFDPQSSATRQNDVSGLKNFRTPRLDLDSLYGRGPDDQHYLYDQSRMHADGFAGFLLTGVGENGIEPDLQRNAQGTAIIGDPRNDENVIVSQLQLAFCLLHNKILEKVIAGETQDAASKRSGREQFEEAQRITTWLYQYVLWNDFISRIVDPEIFAKAIEIQDDKVKFGLDDVYDWSVDPFIPVEFSVGAYRFGHSMIRGRYQLNIVKQDGAIGDELGTPIFSVPGGDGLIKDDLRGGHKLRPKHTIQWDWYFDVPSSLAEFGFPQRAHKIDTKLSQSVFAIPGEPGKTNPLAFLNIRRGWRMELPPASEVARALNLPILPNLTAMEEQLWVYILKEAEQSGGECLGVVGSTLIAAVFSGLLRGDPRAYINKNPKWTPADEGFKSLTGSWTVGDLLDIAEMPLDGEQVGKVIATGVR